MRELYESWACACAAARALVSVSVPDLGLASVDRFPFACRCWLLLGRLRAFPAFLFCLVFFFHFIMCSLPKRRSDYFEFVLHRDVDGWVCFFLFVWLVLFYSLRSCLPRRVGVLLVFFFFF
jgi:hypothetical protein